MYVGLVPRGEPVALDLAQPSPHAVLPNDRSPDCALPAWSSLPLSLSPYSPFPMASLSLSRAVCMSAYPVDPWQFFPMFALTRKNLFPQWICSISAVRRSLFLPRPPARLRVRGTRYRPSIRRRAAHPQTPDARESDADCARCERISCPPPRRSIGWNQRERGERNKGEISQGRR